MNMIDLIVATVIISILGVLSGILAVCLVWKCVSYFL